MTAPNLDGEVEALRHLDLAGLRDTWRRHFGAPPSVRSRDLLRRMLAFELQAATHGGLPPELRQKLRSASTSAPRKPGPQPGSTITREWRGARHVVEVIGSGFVHDGQTYASLSEVARAITGARWSGPRFFGLKDEKKRRAV
ncbi:MAG: DUF2924 domain-containing protein [Dehalococcoidia bacterium]